MKTVILAAGDFPRKGGKAWQLLTTATRVVACDSAANAYHRRFGKWPTVIIGDLDSFKPPSSRFLPPPSSLLPLSDQDTNDLEKAILLCKERGWKNPVIVGATGKREDHTLGNVFRALAYQLEIVTDYGRFLPLIGERTLRVKKGTAISVFVPDPKTRMTSKGLEWPLDGLTFKNLFCATLNRASSSVVRLSSSHPVSVFLSA